MNENNGNGHQKAFELTQPRTPEEIAQDSLRGTMPKLRRACSQDPRLKKYVGAKWLFGVLSDNSFLHDLGGDGWGRVYTSLKKLHKLYGPEEDTLATWRDKLIETGWIWFQERWPYSCWGIKGVCQQPELFAPDRDFVRVTAKASALTQPAAAVDPLPNGKTVNSGHNDRILPADQPAAAVSPTGCGGQSDPILRLVQPKEPVPLAGQSRSDQPNGSVILTGAEGHTHRNGRVRPTEAAGHNKETPRSKGALDTSRGTPPPGEKEFQTWLKSLEGMFPSRLQKLEAELIAKLKSARSPEAKQEWKRRLAAVRVRLLGGPVKDEAPKAGPVRLAKGPAMDPEKAKKLWAKAAESLDPSLKQKAAAVTAA